MNDNKVSMVKKAQIQAALIAAGYEPSEFTLKAKAAGSLTGSPQVEILITAPLQKQEYLLGCVLQTNLIDVLDYSFPVPGLDRPGHIYNYRLAVEVTGQHIHKTPDIRTAEICAAAYRANTTNNPWAPPAPDDTQAERKAENDS